MVNIDPLYVELYMGFYLVDNRIVEVIGKEVDRVTRGFVTVPTIKYKSTEGFLESWDVTHINAVGTFYETREEADRNIIKPGSLSLCRESGRLSSVQGGELDNC